jgi:hypothetical protein
MKSKRGRLSKKDTHHTNNEMRNKNRKELNEE